MRTLLATLLPFLALAGFAPGLAGAGGHNAGTHEGATVEYSLRSAGGAPDGSYRLVTEATLVLHFMDGAWTGTCSGVSTTETEGTTTSESFERASPMPPPRMPDRLHRGDIVDPALLSAAAEGCRHDLGELVVAGRTKDGTKQLVATESPDASAYQDAALTWDARDGLVHEWSFAGRGGGIQGRLVSASGL